MKESNPVSDTHRHYTFPVSSDMLTPGKVAAIGEALWCFLWCVDRTTSEVVRNDERRGRVLGGSVIPAGRISTELGLTEEQIGEQLQTLAKANLLSLIAGDDGYVIEVRHSVKWLNRKTVKTRPERANEGPVPIKSLVEGLRERLAARESAESVRGGIDQ